MRYLFSARNRRVLRKFALANVLVAFDYDGTLAPISSDPVLTAIRPRTRKLLQKVTSLYPCIVVSGRSRKDVQRKLNGIRFGEFIGNHGIEPWNASRAMKRNVEAWIPVLIHRLKHLPGIVVENKRFSTSVHYRRARNKKKAVKTIIEVARILPAASVFRGKQVINIVPDGAPDKGRAVQRALRKTGCDKVIYIGDDVTDEHVFALPRNGHFLTIRVGGNGSSLARFYIRNQREIDRLLKTLIESRASQLNR